jgi:GMP synthase-like glutamine amidotransferase
VTALDLGTVRAGTTSSSQLPAAQSTRVLIVEHEAWAGLGRLAGPLASALPGVILDVVRPYLCDCDHTCAVPRTAAGCSGVVVLGGSMAAWDDEAAPWLPATRDLLRDCVQARVPVLGICLGAQLLALATGGQVRRGAAGPEIGLRPVELLAPASDDPLLSAVPTDARSRFRAVQWHSDAITMPPDAVPLAAGDLYPHQAFRVGDLAWAVQFHPEVTLSGFEGWVADGGRDLMAAGLQPRETLARVQAADGDLRRLADALGTAFAAVVQAEAAKAGRPPDSRLS